MEAVAGNEGESLAVADYEVVTFDCYGTLIDWEAGIVAAFDEAARRAGAAIEPAAVLAAYHEVEPEVEAGPFKPYRRVLAETARRVAARLGWRLDDAGAATLAASLPDWPPFPDTDAALRRLHAAGLRLGILSNVDDDLLAGTRRNLPDVFDPGLILTAEQVGSYKPGHAHFEAAGRLLVGCWWLHAAQSAFHDVAPATALGVPVVWVNRKAEPRPVGLAAPTAEVPDLAALADWLGA